MDRELTEHPVLVPTSRGPAGGIVCEPAHPSPAPLLFLHGAGRSGRSGFNSEWAILSRRLAALGTTVLRVDLGTEGDSLMIGEELYPIDSSEPEKNALDRQLVLEVVEWFLARTGGSSLLVVGSCYGARLGLELAAARDDVAATLMVVPFLRPCNERNLSRWRERMLKVRRGEPTDEFDRLDPEPLARIDPSVLEDFDGALRDGFVWILVGELDPADPLALPALFGERRLQLRVEPGVALYPGNDPDVQELVIDRVSARVARIVDS